ncbi:MerR family transcriptional regulator [Pseudorhodoferax soli]|uniref:MerR family transcriptional regulator n=1 Tax=Pseudorhodoferax soli TaxID=545864 RepID=A0A368XMR9_9BURK|nr:MerR family transcriptional regulator [Pseudorhodoferax soli]RCW68849.1 MerR family transcriptional regulator [Pseudorhodoferax soli]
MGNTLPSIPAKRYFTIGEVGDLCGVKPHVLRYWEQEFTQLRPMKRRGNRRYYQHHEVLMIRRIRDLLYDQGFTISGARNKLQEQHGRPQHEDLAGVDVDAACAQDVDVFTANEVDLGAFDHLLIGDDDVGAAVRLAQVRRELFEIRSLLADIP